VNCAAGGGSPVVGRANSTSVTASHFEDDDASIAYDMGMDFDGSAHLRFAQWLAPRPLLLRPPVKGLGRRAGSMASKIMCLYRMFAQIPFFNRRLNGLSTVVCGGYFCGQASSGRRFSGRKGCR
jgi:hypothetical protein